MISENKKGVTLMEIVIAMVILGFLMVAANRMMGIFVGASNISSKNYDLQSTARISASTVKTSINNASSIFLLNDVAFLPENRTDGWNYIGVERVGNYDEIVQYVYNGTTHERRMLGRSEEGTSITMSFSKTGNDAKKVATTFTAYDKNGQKEVLFDTSFESLNASTVVDWAAGSGSSAFAYRTEAFEVAGGGSRSENLMIGFALDVSGSMTSSFGTNSGKRAHRTYHLRNAITNILNPFLDNPNVWITSVSYDQSVRNGKIFNRPYQLVGDDKDRMIELFDPERYANNNDGPMGHLIMPTGGVTNSGDGLRCVYYKLLDDSDALASGTPSITVNNKVIILVTDGANNYHTIKRSSAGASLDEFYFNRGYEHETANNNGDVFYPVGAGSDMIRSSSGAVVPSVSQPYDEYMYQVGKMIKDSGKIKDTYLVALATNVVSLRKLGTVLGYGEPGSEEHSKHVLSALTVSDIDAVVSTIVDGITMTFEHILGPKR